MLSARLLYYVILELFGILICLYYLILIMIILANWPVSILLASRQIQIMESVSGRFIAVSDTELVFKTKILAEENDKPPSYCFLLMCILQNTSEILADFLLFNWIRYIVIHVLCCTILHSWTTSNKKLGSIAGIPVELLTSNCIKRVKNMNYSSRICVC